MSRNKPKTTKGLESLSSLVFSTESENSANTSTVEDNVVEINASSIDLRVSLDRKKRKGKNVTLVTGFGDLHIDDLKDLAKMLKTKCGVGGAAKDGEIIIQGDHVIKVIDLLREEGFRVKRTGG